MKLVTPLILGFAVSLLALSSCKDDDAYKPIPLQSGAPQAGVFSSFIELPAGVPLGAYTARDVNLGLSAATATQPEDRRTSPWTHKFFPSIGYGTGVSLDVLWLTNGDRHQVLLTAGLGIAYDGLLHGIVAELSKRLNLDLEGQVVLAVNHSHSAPGGHHNSMHFAPGFDRFDPRVASRLVTQFADAAEVAYRDLEPARIGFGVIEDFDPIGTDAIFRDRRNVNDDLLDHNGNPTGPGFKDPRARLLRVDNIAGDLKAVGVHFGIHGTLFSPDNHWTHWDAPGAIKHGVSAALDGLPVVFLQGSAGDMSPVRIGPPLAAADHLARIAAPKVIGALEQIRTSDAPFYLDTVTLSIPQSLKTVKVSRRGTANFRYKSYKYDDESVPNGSPDNSIYDSDGNVHELIDEFTAPTGAGLCDPDTGAVLALMGFGMVGPEDEPYSACVLVDQFADLLTSLYEMDWDSLFEMTKDGLKTIEPGMSTTALGFSKFDGVLVTTIKGTESTTQAGAKVGMLFLPGEPCTLYSLLAESYLNDVGYDLGIVVGFAQDHEGYLLTIEDWLLGGMEAGINIWGPLQAEYYLESALPMAERGLANEVIRIDDLGITPKTNLDVVGFEPLEETRHVTPNAGKQTTEPLPNSQWLVLPMGLERDALNPLEPQTTVVAYDGLYSAAFEGGDVSIDSPRVRLEYQFPDGFKAIDLGDGHAATNFGPGIFLSYTPSPAKPLDFWVERRHYWVVTWQPMGEGISDGEWGNIKLGNYRFVVEGKAIREAGKKAEPYTIELPPFEVVPNRIDFETTDRGFLATYPETAHGLRLRGVVGEPRVATPIPEGVILTIQCTRADEETLVVGADGFIQTPAGSVPCTVRDAVGNVGTLNLEGS